MCQTVSADSSKVPAAEHQLVNAEDRFDQAFRKESPITWWTTLLGPLVGTLLLLTVLALVYGLHFVGKLLATAFITFVFLGRFVILTGASGKEPDLLVLLTSEQLFLMVLYMDLLVGCLLAFHCGFLFRLPVLGPKVSKLVEDGQFILKSNPWMRRTTFLGLIAFVMFPLAATGSVGGSIFGRLLGLSRLATFLGVVVGSVLGCGVMYLGNDAIDSFADRDNALLKVGGIVVVGLLLLWLNYRYRRLKASSELPTEPG